MLSMVFYLYAILGISLFRHNDPANFGNLGMALLALFRICTMDWVEVMYINVYGCAKSGYEACASVGTTSNQGNPFVASVFFISFVMVSGLILLSLFIGVIGMGMQESVEQMQEENREKERQKAMDKAAQDMGRDSMKNSKLAKMAAAAWEGRDIGEIEDQEQHENVGACGHKYLLLATCCRHVTTSKRFQNGIVAV